MSAAPGPLLRIVRGDPTEEEIAAVTVAVLAALRGAEPAEATPPAPNPAAWLRPERTVAFRPGHSWQRVIRTVEPSCAES